MRLEQLGRRLIPHLERVAAVDPDAGAVGQDDGEAGGAGEAGEPGEALRVRWDVLALVLVGAGDEEASQTQTR